MKITTFHNFWFLIALERWVYSSFEFFGEAMGEENYEDMKSCAEKLASDENFTPQRYRTNLRVNIDDIQIEENIKKLVT